MPLKVLNKSTLFFCALIWSLALGASAVFAACEEPQSSPTSCIGKPCFEIGMSQKDSGDRSIVACLYKDSTKTSQIWKSITGPDTAVEEKMPSGMVLPTSLYACPTGWSPFVYANGRAVIVAGQGAGLSYRGMGDDGGDETRTLAVDHLPSHRHGLSLFYAGPGVYGTPKYTYGSLPYTDIPGENFEWTYGAGVDYTGGGSSFNIMMPWIALQYCQKD